jgi:hypothetical protein
MESCVPDGKRDKIFLNTDYADFTDLFKRIEPLSLKRKRDRIVIDIEEAAKEN